MLRYYVQFKTNLPKEDSRHYRLPFFTISSIKHLCMSHIYISVFIIHSKFLQSQSLSYSSLHLCTPNAYVAQSYITFCLTTSPLDKPSQRFEILSNLHQQYTINIQTSHGQCYFLFKTSSTQNIFHSLWLQSPYFNPVTGDFPEPMVFVAAVDLGHECVMALDTLKGTNKNKWGLHSLGSRQAVKVKKG